MDKTTKALLQSLKTYKEFGFRKSRIITNKFKSDSPGGIILILAANQKQNYFKVTFVNYYILKGWKILLSCLQAYEKL
jgi:hypothetical protein